MRDATAPPGGGPGGPSHGAFQDPTTRRQLEDLRAGRIHPVGEVDLDLDPHATTVVHSRACTRKSVVVLMPRNANAAAEIGAGTLFITPDTGKFTIEHSKSVGTRSFHWAIISRANKPA